MKKAQILALFLVMTTPLSSLALEIYECKPNPAFDPKDYPANFMNAKIMIHNKKVLHIDLRVPDNDPYGSCGKTNVGQFNIATTEEVKGDLSLLSGTLTLKNTYVPHPNSIQPQEIEESLELKVLSSTTKTKVMEIIYGGDCNEYTWGVSDKIKLECTLK